MRKQPVLMNTYTLKPSSTEDFFQAFTAQATKITGEPAYDNIRQLRNTIYENAASVNSSSGGGNHGHLGMVMDATTYATIADIAWVLPVEPPEAPIIPVAATGPHISEANQAHAQALRERREFQNLDKALLRQIVESIEPLFLKPFALPYVGLLGTRGESQQILPYDATGEPFQILIDGFEEARMYSLDGNLPITDAQLINSGLVALKNTGVLDRFVDLWADKPLENRNTWLAFKQHFQSRILEYQKGRKTHNGPTAYSLNTTHINDVEFILTPLSIMNNTHQTQMANMAATKSELLQQLATMHEQFAALTAHKQWNPPPSHAPAATPVSNNNTTGKRSGKRKENGMYCWSHGYRVRGAHNSATCTNPNPGHQTGATCTNTMGGSVQGKPVPNAAFPA